MDIYAAGEDPIEGVSSRDLYEGIRSHGHRNVHYIPDQQQVVSWLLDELEAGDMLITMGAGDVYRVGKQFLEIKRREED